MTVSLIYLSGFLVTYYGLRFMAKGADDWNWSSFWLCFCLGILSWVGFLFVVAIIIFTSLKGDKPPKYL